MLFMRYIRPQKQYIDDYYFCVVKMEKVCTIAVSFGKNVHNRGLTLKNEQVKYSTGFGSREVLEAIKSL